ncbi:MAG: dTDP-4-dehydrorhamnose 3,5-epimerase [Flavobacteriales bacterium]|nr:dTDP-4-dehydrorhamnose 3,5-epimerase [Flavobacteriales bacterium]
MDIIKTHIEGLLVVQPTVFEDSRGYFFESYNETQFQKAGILEQFIQDNQSKSQKGVLRGLHFQNPPFSQGKLVRVITGSVLDVALDIRTNSPTYGQYFKIELTEQNKTMLWVPPGFAHGFATLENNTVFSYKCTNLYNKESEGCILWNDPTLNINWQLDNPTLSKKDEQGIPFQNFSSLF